MLEDIKKTLWATADKLRANMDAAELFFNTQIPACLWFLAKDKRVRRGEVLFIDARKLAG